jgi:UDP:flavonoid glycosyltransferase YjiC (YdhE family)
MKVLFTSWAWPSHYFPVVPLGWALQGAGHQVRVACQPGLTGTVTKSGLPAVPVGHDVDYVALMRPQVDFAVRASQLGTGTARPSRRDYTEITKSAVGVFVTIAESMADDLLAFVRHWRPDLVVYEPTTHAGPIAAAALGVPAVRHTWGIDYTARTRDVETELLTPLCRRLGTGPVDTLGTVTVDPCPPSLQVPADGPRLGVRYVPYNGPGTVPAWLLDPPPGPRICITWGTSSERLGGLDYLVPAVLSAARRLGPRPGRAGPEPALVAAVSDAARLGPDVASGVRVVESLPLHLLLPACDLIVHQGGLGTLLTALSCGLPQLIIPQLPDQRLNAERLAATGAGRVLAAEDADEAAIAAELGRLLTDPAAHNAAQRLYQEMRDQPAPAEIAGELESLAGSGKPAAGKDAPWTAAGSAVEYRDGRSDSAATPG